MTNHLDEGTLQAFLDDELPTAERGAAAEHMLACEQCRGSHEELKRASAVFSAAVSLLDEEAEPEGVARAARWGGGRGVGSLAKAAGLILAVAAAASAAVPGSPVRGWVRQVVGGAAPAVAPPTVSAARVEEPPMPAGVAVIPSGGALDVTLEDVEQVTIRLRQTSVDEASVSVVGAAAEPRFETGRGRIGVRGVAGGELLIELPESVTYARLVVNGDVYAELSDGKLRALVPARESGGELIWP